MSIESTIRFTSFPRTAPPPTFVERIADVFRANETEIGTDSRTKGLTSNQVLMVLRPALADLGFAVERGKRKADKIERPVFYGENGASTLHYEIDAYHTEWQCGLEVEAGRALKGNAVYRDLILASLMTNVDHFVLAIPNVYRYKHRGRPRTGRDYEKTRDLAETIFAHSRLALPYRLTVLGY